LTTSFSNNGFLTPAQRAAEQALLRNPQQIASRLLGLSPFLGMNGLLGSLGGLPVLGGGDFGGVAPITSGGGNGLAFLGGGGGGAPQPALPNYVTSQPQESTEPQQIGEALNSLGLPNQAGRLYWPLGLRVLAPGPEVQQIRLQIDGLLVQAAAGGSDAASLKTLNQAVARLRYHLAAKGSVMARTTYLEALRFLDRLDEAVRQLKG
jgi:hypothetical protein